MTDTHPDTRHRPGRFVITERYARAAAAQAVDCLDVLLDRPEAHPDHGDPELAMTGVEVQAMAATRNTLSRVAFGEVPLTLRVAGVQHALRQLDAGHGTMEAVVHAARSLAEPVEVQVADPAQGG